MSNAPLMPKATAVWLVDNTALTFDQVAEFTKMHPLEVRAIADGDAARAFREEISSSQGPRARRAGLRPWRFSGAHPENRSDVFIQEQRRAPRDINARGRDPHRATIHLDIAICDIKSSFASAPTLLLAPPAPA